MCWRFRHVDHEGPWSFDNVSPQVLSAILKKLSDFESMTVGEAFGGNPGKDYDVKRSLIETCPGDLTPSGWPTRRGSPGFSYREGGGCTVSA